jgi:hypothetical protein
VQDGVGVADVRLDEGEPLSWKILDPLLFHSARIKGIEVVDGRDAMTIVQKATAEVTTDESSPTCNTNMHIMQFCMTK